VASVSVEGVSATSGAPGTAPSGPGPAATETLGPPSRCDTVTYKAEVEMVPQAHGGALQRGNPGNSGGTGVTRKLREAFRGDLETARLRIVEILGDPEADPKDLIAIFDKLAKYSVPEGGGVTVDAELLNELFEPVQRCVRDSSELQGIREQWLDVLGQRLRA
jgi:hypothetical protein